jgi:hypothetical protein
MYSTPEAPPYSYRTEAPAVSDTPRKSPPKKRVMLILFGIAFLIVLVGLICALVGMSQYNNCTSNTFGAGMMITEKLFLEEIQSETCN